jgi:hypothetical protein
MLRHPWCSSPPHRPYLSPQSRRGRQRSSHRNPWLRLLPRSRSRYCRLFRPFRRIRPSHRRHPSRSIRRLRSHRQRQSTRRSRSTRRMRSYRRLRSTRRSRSTRRFRSIHRLRSRRRFHSTHRFAAIRPCPSSLRSHRRLRFPSLRRSLEIRHSPPVRNRCLSKLPRTTAPGPEAILYSLDLHGTPNAGSRSRKPRAIQRSP